MKDNFARVLYTIASAQSLWGASSADSRRRVVFSFTNTPTQEASNREPEAEAP